jgi:hypothetical protein
MAGIEATCPLPAETAALALRQGRSQGLIGRRLQFIGLRQQFIGFRRQFIDAGETAMGQGAGWRRALGAGLASLAGGDGTAALGAAGRSELTRNQLDEGGVG